MWSVRPPALFAGIAAVVAAAAVLAGAAAGCGGGMPTTTDTPPTFPVEALAVVASSSGAYHVELRTDPQPIVRGAVRAQLVVTGADDAPIDGLGVAVLPWMPAHGHGTSVEPSVTAQGGGVYLVEQLYLYMAGTWELRTALSGAGPLVQDEAVPQVQVP